MQLFFSWTVEGASPPIVPALLSVMPVFRDTVSSEPFSGELGGYWGFLWQCSLVFGRSLLSFLDDAWKLCLVGMLKGKVLIWTEGYFTFHLKGELKKTFSHPISKNSAAKKLLNTGRGSEVWWNLWLIFVLQLPKLATPIMLSRALNDERPFSLLGRAFLLRGFGLSLPENRQSPEGERSQEELQIPTHLLPLIQFKFPCHHSQCHLPPHLLPSPLLNCLQSPCRLVAHVWWHRRGRCAFVLQNAYTVALPIT